MKKKKEKKVNEIEYFTGHPLSFIHHVEEDQRFN